MTVMRSRSMSGTLSAGPAKANSVAAAPFTKKEESFLLFQRLMKVISDLWPKKTAAHVAHFTGVSERSVRFWLALSTRMSVEHAAALLRTDEGYQILEAVMGDSQAEWWLDTKVAAELRASRKAMRAEARRTTRLKELRTQRELYEDQ
ncbi:hypothetical protein LJR220_003381 [Bradyrhizobium sp. LjRoot220]|uniref:hypothetical protein n=1 Tax=Bradyrhizobium sp. LjRoot220 TaxID=3342284 RepID=UPI003ECF7B1B